MTSSNSSSTPSLERGGPRNSTLPDSGDRMERFTGVQQIATGMGDHDPRRHSATPPVLGDANEAFGEPGVIGAWLEPDSAQARQAILSPLALCSICGNGSGGTTQDSKPSPPAMGAGHGSIHRHLDSERSSAFPRGHFLLVGG